MRTASLVEKIAGAVVAEIAASDEIWRKVDAHMVEALEATPHDDAYLCLGDTPEEHRVEIRLFGADEVISLPVQVDGIYTDDCMHPEDAAVTLLTCGRLRAFASALLAMADKVEAEAQSGAAKWAERFGNKP